MKNLIDNLKNFYVVEKINDESFSILTPFYLLDTNNTYSINVIKENDKYIIHDGSSIVQFINDNELQIDMSTLQKLLKEFPNIQIVDDSVITVETDEEHFNFDLAKYIQFITKFLS